MNEVLRWWPLVPIVMAPLLVAGLTRRFAGPSASTRSLAVFSALAVFAVLPALYLAIGLSLARFIATAIVLVDMCGPVGAFRAASALSGEGVELDIESYSWYIEGQGDVPTRLCEGNLDF